MGVPAGWIAGKWNELTCFCLSVEDLKNHFSDGPPRRLFEFCDGAPMCLATTATAPAEPLARVALEGAANLLYVRKSNHEQRRFGHFFRCLTTHRGRLKDWASHVASKASDPRILKAIKHREMAR